MKNTPFYKVYLLCIIAVFISGCATWTKAGGPYVDSPSKYSLDLPWGWMKYAGKDLLLTRDGIFLENIEVKRVNINKKLEHTKKKFMKGMLTEEISGVEIDDVLSSQDINNFEVIENIPITLSGQNAFRLFYAFRNNDGLKYKRIHYGFGYEDWVYSLIYTSCADYYFDKNLEEFNKLIESFKFLPTVEGKTIIPSLGN